MLSSTTATASATAAAALRRGASQPRCSFILCAVCQVRITTSPTRPMACESDDIIENAPVSCRMSSAAMVSRRMRDSAKATSSAIEGSRWWHTMSMSRCSSMVLTVYGRVGLVEDGSTLGRLMARMMSGAWPPPAPSVWKVWMVRSLNAASVVSTKPDSLSVSVWMATWMSICSATVRQLSIAAGVVPQSSCSLRPITPACTCSFSGAGRLALPLPKKPRFIGKASAASSMRWMCHGPGVQVVAKVPVAGPVPPPSMVVTPELSASSICCGQIQWMWLSMPPAVRIMPSPAITSVPAPIGIVTPGWMSGLPPLPIFQMRPSFKPTSAFTMPATASMISALVTMVSATSAETPWPWPMPSRITLPPPNFTSSP